jgi:hypothetical protein
MDPGLLYPSIREEQQLFLDGNPLMTEGPDAYICVTAIQDTSALAMDEMDE